MLPPLTQTEHRPWPLPNGPWVMTQVWHDLLFAHWPLPAEALRRAVPAALELDLFEGQAWLGVVPFGMARVFPRGAFPVPWLSRFLELNVRTYVRHGAKAGVYFFSLDAANPAAVAIARRWYQLPYFNAAMTLRRAGEWRHYRSYRTHRAAPPAEFQARYQPCGPVLRAQPGSLEHWLTERYCLYTVGRRGEVYCGEIHHAPWPLQPAEAEIEANTMASPHGLALPDTAPLLHFAQRLETLEWPIARIGRKTQPRSRPAAIQSPQADNP
jgi:uncharacterized protein YqjF (DUF2071 family)